MNKSVLGIVVCGMAGLLVGCQGGPTSPQPSGQASQQQPQQGGGLGPVPTPVNDRPIARVAGRTIDERELRDPLVEAYGLNMLLNLVALDLAEREADRAGVKVTEADVADERQRTVDRMFAQSNAPQLGKIETLRATDPAGADKLLAELRKDNDASLDQLLAQQHISRPEFDLVIRTNATLTKVVDPQVTAAITDEKLRESFRVQYGEKVKVRHIQTNNLTDLNTARRRLAAGEPFETVAKDISTNRATGPLGGEVPAFTRNNNAFPQAFRDAAFGLQPGQVSEAVQADGAFHLIKLDQRIDPTAVKFEDVRESVRADLHDKLLQASVRNLRQQIGQEALAGLSIDDPILKKQFDAKLAAQQVKFRDQEATREELNRQRAAILAQQEAELAAAATQPATTTSTTTRASTSNFLDGILPSTMPAPMKSPLPNELPPETQPTTTAPIPMP